MNPSLDYLVNSYIFVSNINKKHKCIGLGQIAKWLLPKTSRDFPGEKKTNLYPSWLLHMHSLKKDQTGSDYG